MKLLSLSTLEDLVLNIYREQAADRAHATLLIGDLRQEWLKLSLREADFSRAIVSLCESGICQPLSDQHGHALQITTLGADYLHSNNGLLGLKWLARRRAAASSIKHLRRTQQEQPTGRTRRHEDIGHLPLGGMA